MYSTVSFLVCQSKVFNLFFSALEVERTAEEVNSLRIVDETVDCCTLLAVVFICTIVQHLTFNIFVDTTHVIGREIKKLVL